MRSVICGNDERELWLHARAYKACTGAEAVGVVCDVDGPAARRAGKMGLRIFNNFEDVLSDKTVDIIEILSSSPDRTDRALEAMEIGKHLLLSPPFGDDPSSAKQISMASNKSHGLMMVAENWKFFPPVRKLSNLVKKKTVGRVTSIRMRTVVAGSGGWDGYLNPDFRNAAPEPEIDNPSWILKELYEKLAIAYEFLGPVKQVFCIDREVGGGRVSTVTWQHTGHAMYGALDITHAPKMNIRSAYYSRDDNIELTGGSGIIWFTMACSQMKIEPTIRVYRGENQFAYGNLEDDWQAGYEKMLQHFTSCITSGRPPDVSSKHAARIMEYASAAIESAATGKRITL